MSTRLKIGLGIYLGIGSLLFWRRMSGVTDMAPGVKKSLAFRYILGWPFLLFYIKD